MKNYIIPNCTFFIVENQYTYIRSMEAFLSSLKEEECNFMRVCCFCGERIFDISLEKDGYCYFCEEEVYTVETTEIKTAVIESEIFYFEDLCLLTQFDLIMDSKGSNKEKLSKLKTCVENKFWRVCKDE